LTTDQFTEAFGPTEQDYQSAIRFARANGLQVTTTHGNRMLLSVSGPAANVENAFHVNLRVYQHPRETRTFYAPDREPSLV
jgi:kumamolisin